VDSTLRSLERMDEESVLAEKFRGDLERVQQEVAKALDDLRDRLATKLNTIVKARLVEPLRAAVALQHERARALPEAWRSLHHSTYKAILRHRGEFVGSSGSFDWNHDLTATLQDVLEERYEVCFSELGEACDSFLDEIEASVNAMRSLLMDVDELAGDAKAAVATLTGELESYLSSRSAMSKLAWIEGLTRVRRGFVDRLKQVVQAEMAPIYLEVAKENGPKIQIRRTEVLTKQLAMNLGGILEKALQALEHDFRAEVVLGDSSLFAVLIDAMVGSANAKFAAETQNLFEKIQNDTERQKRKRDAAMIRGERQKLHALLQEMNSRGLEIEIRTAGRPDADRVQAIKARLREKIRRIGQVAGALRAMKSSSSSNLGNP